MSELDETIAATGEGQVSVARSPIWHTLRAARETQGLTVGEVAHRLKFTPKQIEAMEAGDMAHLPGAAFARGFMRNYARFLQLDPQPFIDALSEAVPVSDANVPMRHSSLGRMPQPGQAERSSMRALLVSVALLGLAIAGWYFGWLEPADEADLEPAASVVEPAPPAAGVTIESVSTPLAESLAAPAASEPAASGPVAEPAASAPAVATSAPAALVSAAPVPPGYKRMVFSFAGDAWVEVRDASGNVLHSRLNAAGTTQEVQGRPPFTVVVGNAPQVKLSYGGQDVDLVPHTRVMVARFNLE